MLFHNKKSPHPRQAEGVNSDVFFGQQYPNFQFTLQAKNGIFFP